jgi:uncharacterized protein (TIGR04255 family)
MKKEIYANAPIVEAVLDIRVRTNVIPDLDTLSKITDSSYPTPFRQPFRMEVKIEAGNSPAQPSLQQLSTPLGVMYRSSDEKQVFQARVDGFTFNRLAPYENWDSFSREARRLWNLYRSAVQIGHIEMIGLTYLNQLMVPINSRFEDYLRTYIHVAPEIPQVLNNYSLSFQVTLDKEHGFLAISQGYGPLRKMGFITVILNIQGNKAFAEDDNVTDDALWTAFENLREAKSDAFEACITDKIREMIR